MKDLDAATLLAVFEEMLGWTMWPLLALAVLATLAFLWVLWRDGGLRPALLVTAQLLSVLGGIAAVLIMLIVTHSAFADMGGPIDWLLVLGIFVGGAVGTGLGLYALFGLIGGRRSSVNDDGSGWAGRNVGTLDRAARIVAGLGLLAAGVFGPLGAWGLIGLVPLATAFIGWCPAYPLLGINTCRASRRASA